MVSSSAVQIITTFQQHTGYPVLEKSNPTTVSKKLLDDSRFSVHVARELFSFAVCCCQANVRFNLLSIESFQRVSVDDSR